MTQQVLPPEKLLYRPTEAAQALGISRSKLYVLMARGELDSVLVGGSRRVPLTALNSFVARLSSQQETAGRNRPVASAPAHRDHRR